MPKVINSTQEEENVDYCQDWWRRLDVREIDTHTDLARVLNLTEDDR
jgi:hypothetical protein